MTTRPNLHDRYRHHRKEGVPARQALLLARFDLYVEAALAAASPATTDRRSGATTRTIPGSFFALPDGVDVEVTVEMDTDWDWPWSPEDQGIEVVKVPRRWDVEDIDPDYGDDLRPHGGHAPWVLYHQGGWHDADQYLTVDPADWPAPKGMARGPLVQHRREACEAWLKAVADEKDDLERYGVHTLAARVLYEGEVIAEDNLGGLLWTDGDRYGDDAVLRNGWDAVEDAVYTARRAIVDGTALADDLNYAQGRVEALTALRAALLA